MNEQFVLRQRPTGLPTRQEVELVQAPLPQIMDDEDVLLKTRYLSLDPYMYGRMAGTQAYTAPIDIGDVIVGETVSEVVESASGRFSAGDLVTSQGGWQRFSVAQASAIRPVPEHGLSPTTALGVLGMPGFTAYAAMTTFGQPTSGETVAVAAASGPVGSMAGQLARLMGARVIGIAGGARKTQALLDWGFDTAVDHQSPDFADTLKRAISSGIDVYLENVGGAVWREVLPFLNAHARVPVCGLVADYNGTSRPSPTGFGEQIMRTVLQKRLNVRGFVVGEFSPKLREQFLAEMPELVKDGSVKYQEQIHEEFARTPEIFVDMLHGKSFGKTIVRVS